MEPKIRKEKFNVTYERKKVRIQNMALIFDQIHGKFFSYNMNEAPLGLIIYERRLMDINVYSTRMSNFNYISDQRNINFLAARSDIPS